MLAYETLSEEDLKIVRITDDLNEVAAAMKSHREWQHGKREHPDRKAPCSEDM